MGQYLKIEDIKQEFSLREKLGFMSFKLEKTSDIVHDMIVFHGCLS